MGSSRSCHCHDQHTWQDHNANFHAAWTFQIPKLISAYLASKSDMDSHMDVDRSTLGQHTFHIDIFGLQGKHN